MEFRLSAEQELFKRMVREYCDEYVEPRSREIDDKEDGIPDEIIQGLADLGVFASTFALLSVNSAKQSPAFEYKQRWGLLPFDMLRTGVALLLATTYDSRSSRARGLILTILTDY